MKKLKVCVIGAGPSGLCATKHLLTKKYGDIHFEVVVFDEQNEVGGTWIYNNEKKSKDQNKFVSAIYHNLRVDLPKQVMCFPDFPFPPETSTFPHHTIVRKYISNYAEVNDILPFVQFNTRVIKVYPHEENEETRFIKWKVETQNIQSKKLECETFDRVFVCNGHHSTPNIPVIQGLEHFKGEILHSKSYNSPQQFIDKIVLVVGYGMSALDIVVDICDTCKFVYISKRNKQPFIKLPKHDEVKELGDIVRILDNGNILLEKNVEIKIDVLLLCTGYLYDYPFLSDECCIQVKENKKVVSPLYKHVFHTIYPSMVFIGLCFRVSTFPMVHQQCAYAVDVFAGKTKLPSQKEMDEETNNEIMRMIESGQPYSNYHSMPIEQFVYNDELAELSGEEKNPKIIKNLFYYTAQTMIDDFNNFKSKEYLQVDNESFTVLK